MAEFTKGDVGEIAKGLGDISSMSCRLEANKFAYDAQYVAAAFFGRNEFLDAVAEHHHAHLVVVVYGREGQRGCNLGYKLRLVLAGGAEDVRATNIDEEHHRQFAFLFEHLDVGVVETRGDVPVDVAHIVAVLVFSHLAECHTAAFECTVVFAREHLLRQTSRANLNPPHLFYYVVFFQSEVISIINYQFSILRDVYAVKNFINDLLALDVFGLSFVG